MNKKILMFTFMLFCFCITFSLSACNKNNDSTHTPNENELNIVPTVTNFASLYFSTLKKDTKETDKGLLFAAYLLSFYDTYYNDDIIAEDYETKISLKKEFDRDDYKNLSKVFDDAPKFTNKFLATLKDLKKI